MKLKHQVITRITLGVFKVYTLDTPNSHLVVNFTPFLNRYPETQATLFIHWQARPKYQRRWGVYDRTQDKYLSAEGIIFQSASVLEGVQLKESLIATVPTSVLLSKHRILNGDRQQIILGT